MFASMEAIIEEIAAGNTIIVYDDVDGEEEGDLVCAAELVTPNAINFMSAYGRGLIYVPTTNDILRRIGAIPVYDPNKSGHTPVMYAPIDYKGYGTGSSPHDKASTIHKMLDPESKPGNFRSPGHVFPMRVEGSGVLEKPNHGEAGVDLARLAGLFPAAVICEIVGEDGYMAQLPELQRFAMRHHLHMVAISNIVEWIGSNGSNDQLLKKLRTKSIQMKKRQQPRQAHYTFEHIVGHSPAILSAIESSRLAARTNCRILIQGETGTGKEMFAQSIHNSSVRQSGPFIGVNCAAIPNDLLESELFGYEEGAFTGAGKGGKPGCFELARGGTLFLDEIDSLPFHMQAKLLRVLQEQKLRRVGGTKDVELDARIVAASSKRLDWESTQGNFRRDLYYRLSTVIIDLPPLRERTVDIPSLAYILAQNLGHELGKDIRSISDNVIRELQRHNWPGNVRELANVIERSLILNPSNTGLLADIRMQDTRAGYGGRPAHDHGAGTGAGEGAFNLQDMEKRVISQALLHTNNNVSKASDLLGIDRKTLYRKIKAYDLVE